MHVALIMDGNGRWATGRGKPRVAGHQRGAERIRDVVESAPALGVDVLTLYAFSGDNWRRPASEVAALMSLFDRYLRSEAANLRKAGVRLTVIGRRDRLPQPLVLGIGAAERLTASGSRLRLRLAIDYSSREAIRQAAQAAWRLPTWSDASFECRIGSGRGAPAETPDVDLLIRTGGELRLSDFLLWECAYAELWFTNTAWPDFGAKEFRGAVDTFRARDRRFGALPACSRGST
jgi:undecaprenyl diphosphate synthase